MADDIIVKAFESVGIPKMQILIYLDLLKNKEKIPNCRFQSGNNRKSFKIQNPLRLW